MYTLANNETNKPRQKQVIVNGVGSDLSKKEALEGRAKRKTITQSMMLQLIKVAEETEDTEMLKGFWNTYYCQKKVITANGKLYGDYCKNRFCTICSTIRKAEIINRYYPIIKTWEDPHFVTITIQSVKEDKLKARLESVLRGFRRINAKHRKRNQRGKGIRLMGIKSLECNYNPVKKTYNPHLHIITANKEIGDIIIADWLKLCTNEFANGLGQKISRVWDIEKSLIEIIKYGSKIFTEPDLIKRDKETTTAQIYIRALNNILKAMKGKRIFDRFGFNLPPATDAETTPPQILSDYEKWEFNPVASDWESDTTSEKLTGYKLSSNLQSMLQNNMNTTAK